MFTQNTNDACVQARGRTENRHTNVMPTTNRRSFVKVLLSNMSCFHITSLIEQCETRRLKYPSLQSVTKRSMKQQQGPPPPQPSSMAPIGCSRYVPALAFMIRPCDGIAFLHATLIRGLAPMAASNMQLQAPSLQSFDTVLRNGCAHCG